MKKLLIVIPSYRWGGDSTALFNLLNHLDPNRYSIDIFPLVNEGPYKDRYTHCSFLNSNASVEALVKPFHPSASLSAFRPFVFKTLKRLSNGKYMRFVFRRVGRKLVQNSHYDAVIAWTEWEPTIFVSCIPHKYKLAWMHCDYAANLHSRMDDEAYTELDRIICVSRFCKGRFLCLFPDLKDKVVVLHNVLDVLTIKEKAGELISDYPHVDSFNILSAGRIAASKRFSAIPAIALKLKEAGLRFHWSIIGPNQHPDELDKIKLEIEKHGVFDCVEYLGVKTNPFPYMRNADLVVNTSATEALPYSILEALIVGTPTINADFEAAYEVLENGKNGLIVPLDQIAGTIINYFNDDKLQKAIKSSIQHYIYKDEIVLEEFDELFS